MATSSRSRSSHPPAASCTPCSLLTRLFRIPAFAALSIRAFRFCNLRKAATKMSPRRRRRPRRMYQSVRTVFWPLVPPSSSTPATSTEGDTARRVESEAVPETPVHAPSPSPEKPAYVKMVARLRSRRSTSVAVGEEKEEACWSFESCLMEILTEEGKAKDLQDVEELLQCWEKLKSPVFVDLVCRYYGELCKDLFSSAGSEDGDTHRLDEGTSVSTSAA